MSGITPNRQGLFIEDDRAQAIKKAIRLAGPKDVVLIAGKGHENTQVFSDRVVPFSDLEVARACLADASAQSQHWTTGGLQ